VTEPQFDKTFEPAHGEAVPVASDVLRVTAPNAGPLTFHGTNSYIVGRDTLAVIDPGPEEESHWRTLEAAIAGRPVSHIFVTHTHRDHSPLTARLKQKTEPPSLPKGRTGRRGRFTPAKSIR
jgi:glyoxylase-like metal-dependent hydrolase (beta-lactamase superfamily II)